MCYRSHAVTQSPHDLPGPGSPRKSWQQAAATPCPSWVESVAAPASVPREPGSARPPPAPSSYPKLGLMLTWCMPSTVRMSLPQHAATLQLTQ